MFAWMTAEATYFDQFEEINAYDSYTEEAIGTFTSYKEFRNTYPSAEIVGVEVQGNACEVYC